MAKTHKENGNGLRIQIRNVIYRDGDWWISHCLELDIVGQGKTRDEAMDQCLELCAAQIEAALADGDLPSVIRPAPADIWALYYKANGRDHGRAGSGSIERAEFRELRAAV